VADAAFSAIFRKQSRHRQSSLATGIGNFAVSSAHQHDPDRLQLNSVPQPEQARRRMRGFSNRFVINRTEPSPCFVSGSCATADNPAALYARDHAMEIRWPATSRLPLPADGSTIWLIDFNGKNLCIGGTGNSFEPV
jgi:hypothetical protein